MPQVSLNTRISPELEVALREFAAREKKSIASVVEAALKMYLNNAGGNETMTETNYNGVRSYAKDWANCLGSNHTTQTRKNKEGGYVSHIYRGDDLVGKLVFAPDGTTTWSAWEDGSGWSYTEPLDPWNK
jgi:hypothetical protein